MKSAWSNFKGKGRKILVSKYHAAASAAGAVMATAPAWAYDLSDFGLDTLAATVIAIVLLGYVAASGMVALGISAEAIFGVMIRWTKKAFGGR